MANKIADCVWIRSGCDEPGTCAHRALTNTRGQVLPPSTCNNLTDEPMNVLLAETRFLYLKNVLHDGQTSLQIALRFEL